MTVMVILVSTASLVDAKHQYKRNCNTSITITDNRNGNTSEYCSISGQNISTTGMIILVSIAPLVDRTSVQTEW
jgi:exosome complex RNA-binding protein Rrp42 (RNase PH superfamily)